MATALSKSASVTLTPASVANTAATSDTVAGSIVPSGFRRLATMESIGDPAELGGPAKDAVAESGNGGLGGPSGYDGGYVGTAATGPRGAGPGGEGAPESEEGGGLGGCCASARLRITEVRIWLNHVSSHASARYDRSAPPDASPADASASSASVASASASAASRPSRVQSETNHPSPPAGRVASNGGGAGPSPPLCAATPPAPAE
mmetsp:Transcript_5721/g.23649  ORF Transcript_5721/g.23649 Transcript_5721/m.23649 type:complete len:206 (-) Transcript_5721:966-1583(-)